MADDSYEVDVPDSVGPVVRLTPGGEPPVELEVTNGSVTTDNADHAQTISRTFGGEVRVNVQQTGEEPAVADTDGAENASVLPEDRTDSGDSTDEPELPAEPDNTTRSARKAR